MALKLKRETVVDALSGLKKKMAPAMKMYVVLIEPEGKGLGFSSSTDLTDAQLVWLCEHLIAQAKASMAQSAAQGPKLEEEPAAQEATEGSDAGADATAG